MTVSTVVIWTALALPALASGTHFGAKPIIVNGSSSVLATALNNRGSVTGYFVDSNGDYNGFLQRGSNVEVIPPLCNSGVDCFAQPADINAADDVVGIAYEGTCLGFLWRNGHFVARGTVSLSYSCSAFFPASIGINNKRVEYYNVSSDDLYQVYVGTPGNFVQISPPGNAPAAIGINDGGSVVGATDAPGPGLFLWLSGQFNFISPPGATAALDGVINNQNDVAGLFYDSQGRTHGFVFHNNSYTTFDVPGGATKFTITAVNGINSSGRVVGTYQNFDGSQQGLFLYNGATVTKFGNYSSSHFLHIAINDEGVMIVADKTDTSLASHRVLCAGDGC